jgi:LPS O-antigen subunit length determinant protein (WzzB/FepE family)
MKKKSTLYYDDQIDFINLLMIIWNNKIKILLITIISFLIGFGYSYQIPNNYLFSLSVKKSNQSEFNRIASVAGLMQMNLYNISNVNSLILSRFISELEDYEEFLLSLKNTKRVREVIQDLSIGDQEKKLSAYVNLLEIVRSKKKDDDEVILRFKWNNIAEARDILQETLKLTSNNLEKRIFKDLDQHLYFKNKEVLSQDKVRLRYLREQSLIAKELNIIDNQIPNENLSQFPVSLNIRTTDIAYYLRGYKAIDKEIELIRNRDYKQFEHIEKELVFLKKQSKKWVVYNIHFLEVKSFKNTKLILLISILSGLIAGILYSIISHEFNKKLATKK